LPSDEVLIHPGSGSVAKNWPPERLARVMGALRHPVRLIVGEADTRAASQIEHILGQHLPRVEENPTLDQHLARLENVPLPELAARLAGCRAYLGNDSGVSHLAGLCGAPSVVMFGPTPASVWRPLGPRVAVMDFLTPPEHVADMLMSGVPQPNG
jgi:ADP-heptose:LPS heptosyltransferase